MHNPASKTSRALGFARAQTPELSAVLCRSDRLASRERTHTVRHGLDGLPTHDKALGPVNMFAIAGVECLASALVFERSIRPPSGRRVEEVLPPDAEVFREPVETAKGWTR
jgi:hypothetical protein